jgi:Flp pilus assembly protein TadG
VKRNPGTAGGRRRRWWRILARGDGGASPVELAIVSFGMLVLTFSVIQVGLIFYARSLAHVSATQAVNAARGYGATDEAGRIKAQTFLDRAGAGLRSPVVTIRRVGNDVTVTVSGSAISVLPFLTFGIEQSAHGSVERVT